MGAHEKKITEETLLIFLGGVVERRLRRAEEDVPVDVTAMEKVLAGTQPAGGLDPLSQRFPAGSPRFGPAARRLKQIAAVTDPIAAAQRLEQRQVFFRQGILFVSKGILHQKPAQVGGFGAQTKLVVGVAGGEIDRTAAVADFAAQQPKALNPGQFG